MTIGASVMCVPEVLFQNCTTRASGAVLIAACRRSASNDALFVSAAAASAADWPGGACNAQRPFAQSNRFSVNTRRGGSTLVAADLSAPDSSAPRYSRSSCGNVFPHRVSYDLPWRFLRLFVVFVNYNGHTDDYSASVEQFNIFRAADMIGHSL